MQRPRSRKNTRFFRTLLSCVLLIVCCMGVFLCPQRAQAKELTNTVQPISVDSYSLLAWEQTGSDYQQTVRPLDNGRIDFNYTGASTVRFAMQLELRNYDFTLDDYYGNLEALSVLIRLKFRVHFDSNIYSGSDSVFEDLGGVSLYVPGSPAQLASSSYSYVTTPVEGSDSYDCELTLTATPATLDAFDAGNLSLFISGANFLVPFVEDPSSGSYVSQIVVQPFVGTVEFEYYRDTVGDVINDNLEDLKDSLTTPSSDVASDVSDFEQSVSSAVQDIMDQEQEWQDSIEAIYESYGVDPDSMEYKFKDVVADLRLEATTGWLSDLWNFFKDYKFLYLFLNTGLVFCMIVFLLRR